MWASPHFQQRATLPPHQAHNPTREEDSATPVTLLATEAPGHPSPAPNTTGCFDESRAALISDVQPIAHAIAEQVDRKHGQANCHGRR